jgi:hypothetical protein
MDAYYSGQGGDLPALFEAAAHSELMNQEDTQEDLIGSPIHFDMLESIEMGIELAKEYALWAPSVDNFEEVVEMEREVLVPLFADVAFVGRVDGLVRRNGGQLWLLEFKTTKSLPSDDMWLEVDTQATAYCWAVSQMMQERVHGVIYTFVFKKMPKTPEPLKSGKLSTAKGKLSSTTARRYYDAILDNELDPEPYKETLRMLRDRPSPFFRRIFTRRTTKEVEWFDRAIRVQGFEMTSPAVPIYPQPERLKCATCAFMAPCIARSDGSNWKAILQSGFRPRPERK